MKLDITVNELRMIKVALYNDSLILKMSKDVPSTTEKQKETLEKERKAMLKLLRRLGG